MARPRLELGTPRFSGLGAKVSNKAKPLRTGWFPGDRPCRRDSRSLRSFPLRLGTGIAPSTQSRPSGDARWVHAPAQWRTGAPSAKRSSSPTPSRNDIALPMYSVSAPPTHSRCSWRQALASCRPSDGQRDPPEAGRCDSFDRSWQLGCDHVGVLDGRHAVEQLGRACPQRLAVGGPVRVTS
jgi:hypothetical protein